MRMRSGFRGFGRACRDAISARASSGRHAAVLAIVIAGSTPAVAQEAARPVRAKSGSEFWIPLGSVLIPGLGQYVHGAPLTGAAFTATALTGAAVGATAGTGVVTQDDFPRNSADQLAFEGYHVALAAGMVSAWDAFQRTVPAMQAEGKYGFLTERDNLGGLLTAPFDVRFMNRWTTWVHFAYTGLLSALVLSDREPNLAYEPLRGHDIAFISALSFNAGIGEEAVFRGWLFPMFYQLFGDNFWAGNAVQAGMFGGLHAGQAGPFALMIAGWALYEGWLTQRNGWSIRESIFHHFWYDVAIGVATLLNDERQGVIGVTFPTIRF